MTYYALFYALVVAGQIWLMYQAFCAFMRVRQGERRKFDIMRYAVGIDQAASFHIRLWSILNGHLVLTYEWTDIMAIALKTAALLFLIRVMHLKEKRL